MAAAPPDRPSTPTRDAAAALMIQAIAAGRVALGVTALAMPGALTAALFGRGGGERERPALRMFTRMLGARDVALGAATLAAAAHPRALRRLALLGVACDAVDTLVTLGQPGMSRRTRRLVATSALLAAAGGAASAWQTSHQQGSGPGRDLTRPDPT